MIYARIEDGWIRIPYSGPELARVEIAVGEVEPGAWRKAFLNTVGSERVAQVRPLGLGLTQEPKVWIRIDGAAMLIGRLGQTTVPTRPHRRGR